MHLQCSKFYPVNYTVEIFSPISDLAFFEVLLLDDCACVTVPVSVDESDGAGLRRKRETMCELTDKW